jgi:hypothetical protein
VKGLGCKGMSVGVIDLNRVEDDEGEKKVSEESIKII